MKCPTSVSAWKVYQVESVCTSLLLGRGDRGEIFCDFGAAFCRLPRRLPRRPLPPLPGPTPPPPPPPTTPSSPRWASRAGRGRSRRQAGAACPARRGQRRRRVGARFRCARLPAETARGASRHRAGAGVVHSEPVRRARVVALGVPAPRGLLGLAVLHGLPIPARMLMSCPHIHISGARAEVSPGGSLEYAWDWRYG